MPSINCNSCVEMLGSHSTKHHAIMWAALHLKERKPSMVDLTLVAIGAHTGFLDYTARHKYIGS